MIGALPVQLRVRTAHTPIGDTDLKEAVVLADGRGLYANLDEAACCLELDSDRHVYLFGEVFYHIVGDCEIKVVEARNGEYLAKIFRENKLEDVIGRLEGQYIGLFADAAKRSARLFSDRYARLDCFYACDGSDFFLATDLDFLFDHIRPEYDQVMLGHIFCTYGWYTPKGLTIYKNVKQLRVGEIITLSGAEPQFNEMEFRPAEIEEYTEDHLEVYYKLLREAVVSRAGNTGKVWVSSSSGWDSSMILGLLIDEFGPDKVGMITGCMKYSDETEIINKFEVEKTRKIGAFYGLSPELVDFDLRGTAASDYWGSIVPYYKSRHMYAYAAYNFTRLSDALRDIAGDRCLVFNGETSDSFHNFGFSQFTTFFHTRKPFTEYADKMNCYLYGPSFLKKVLDGSYEKDSVYQIFRRMRDGVEYCAGDGSRASTIERFLFPFFYGSPRVPFAATYKNRSLTDAGQQAELSFPYRRFMPEVLAGINETNIYSWLIYLYHSFHSQGGSVNVHKHAMEYNGHAWRMPYDDYRLVQFLSRAPESWGRGLELNNTKYPLKWVARSKISFPYELLDEGPHSYLYEVTEGFSLFHQTIYKSGMTDLFKSSVGERKYKNILDDAFFDLAYLDRLVDGYLSGKEVRGQDFGNLTSLIILAMTGWY